MNYLREGLDMAGVPNFGAGFPTWVGEIMKIMLEAEEKMLRDWCRIHNLDLPEDIKGDLALIQHLLDRVIVYRDVNPVTPEGLSYRILHRAWCIDRKEHPDPYAGMFFSYPCMELRFYEPSLANPAHRAVGLVIYEGENPYEVRRSDRE